ncbi:MAG: AAA family ATPase [Anaerolineae bacterium]
MSDQTFELSAAEFRDFALAIEAQVGQVFVGQRAVVRNVLTCVVAGGHALLEGVPGLGKTTLIRTLADVLELDFSRIQFTPDLMPSDITGTDVLEEDEHGRRVFRFQPGPVFANLVLADEINRATPKTQSAMLEAMQEKSVTVANRTYPLDQPFFVLATQNPLEMEGTYPLPEAQLDRFMFKIDVTFPTSDELVEIISRTTGATRAAAGMVNAGGTIIRMGDLARRVPIATQVSNYVARLIVATHPGSDHATDMVNQYVRVGSSPRGAQSLILGAKVSALLTGEENVAFNDVKAVALPALRHRLLLNFEAQAEGITTNDIVSDLINRVPLQN